MKRKLFTTVSVLLAATILLSSCAPAPAPAPSDVPSTTQPSASGTQPAPEAALSGELNVAVWAGDPFQSAWQDMFDKFKEETGVTVNMDAIPWENLREKCTLEMASGAGSYDVLYVHPLWFEEYVDNKYLVPVNEYATPEELAKYVPGLLNNYTKDGTVYGLPDFITTQVLAYRTDLFEEKGIKPPQNWDDILKAAEAFSDGDNLYGITFPGKRSGALASIFGALLTSNEGWFYDASGKPSINTPAAIETADFMGKLSKFAPTGFMNYQWDENSNVAAAGKSAMALCMAVNSQWLDDPAKSATAGKWAYVPIKSNKGISGGMIDSYCWSVTTSSKNVPAAQALVKFIADTEAQIYFTQKSGTCGATQDYYKNEELLASTPVLAALNDIFATAKPYPTWKTWATQQDTLEVGLQAVMGGTSTGKELMEQLQAQMEAE